MSIQDKVNKMLERMRTGEPMTAEEMIADSNIAPEDAREFAAKLASGVVSIFLDQMTDMGYKYYLVAHHDATNSYVIAGDISSKILGEGIATNSEALLLAKLAVQYATDVQAKKGIYTNIKGGEA